MECDSRAEVHSLWRHLRNFEGSSIEDVVAGACTVGVTFSPDTDALFASGRLASWITSVEQPPWHNSGDAGGPFAPRRTVTIPVSYDGPDLEAVAEATGLTTTDVALCHRSRPWTVDFLGFSPGFAYLSGGDPRLWVARLAKPRLRVPAGSVGVANAMTAVYPQATPGGWMIIGSTSAVIFDPTRAEPCLMAPGDRVVFEAASAPRRPEPRTPEPRTPEPRTPEAPPLRSGNAPAARRESVPDRKDGRPGRPRSRTGEAHEELAYLHVLESGPAATIQDLGRPGFAHLGISRAGSADATSARLGNRLVGNSPGSALVELLLPARGSGAVLRIGAARTVAVTGARVDLTVDGMPGRQDSPLALPAGAELRLGSSKGGLRAYIAIAGGIQASPVLASLSTDTLSGLGPPAIRSGDVLALGAVLPLDVNVGLGPPPRRAAPFGLDAHHRYPMPGDAVLLGARLGPRDDWLDPHGMKVLTSGVFTVSDSTDRTGARLDGPRLSLARSAQIPSEALFAGSVEVTSDGTPIVMLRNHPTTGGYPAVAVVDEAGVDMLSQCPPGVRVRFLFPSRTPAA